MSSLYLCDTNLDDVLRVGVLNAASFIGVKVFGTKGVEGVFHVTDG
jgi:hypothetical protein